MLLGINGGVWMNNYDVSDRLVGILADFVVCCKQLDDNYVVNGIVIQ